MSYTTSWDTIVIRQQERREGDKSSLASPIKSWGSKRLSSFHPATRIIRAASEGD
jgi:hypothetical protein